VWVLGGLLALAGCHTSSPQSSAAARATSSPGARRSARKDDPPFIDARNIYAADRRGDLSPVVRRFPERVYVPNTASNTVDEIDPHTYRVVRQFSVGTLPQHVVPANELRTLWVTNDLGNSLPRSGAERS
jgi:YVTN family beta-propeller protein